MPEGHEQGWHSRKGIKRLRVHDIMNQGVYGTRMS